MEWSQVGSQLQRWPQLWPLLSVPLLITLYALRARDDAHKRGARVLEGRRGRRALRRRKGAGALELAGVPIAAAEETRHFKLIGTTGTGKSTAIAGLLAAALARGDRAVIADPDGGYRAQFFDPRRGDT